ncbi:P-II family nitrogen regulator [Lachnospiraceae bacterium ASD3451]|uniref:P-II family nitrogen regulator n=1 Tax=Diplocloster agilis TaxID=2850323 RepID=UPI001D72914F|nr:P-II family nitrogen regulator [Diplocloster agilis]MBU9745544.1 P-II family nitrogen regulator [Diplocloster agilis]
MSELYLMVTITNRNMLPKFLSFYQERNMEISLITLGKGTANSEMLDYFGLEDSEKAVIFGVVTDSVWLALKKGLQSKLQIDIPGTGIAFTIPLSSIGGKRELLFLTENQDYEKGAESTLTGCTHDLLLVIANQGYSELVMEAARSAGAAGGTIIHAKGTGMEQAEKFLGVSLASEKEMIFIITKTEEKNQIMQAVMRQAGMQSKAKSIVISLPVTSTAGLRLVEEE